MVILKAAHVAFYIYIFGFQKIHDLLVGFI